MARSLWLDMEDWNGSKNEAKTAGSSKESTKTHDSDQTEQNYFKEFNQTQKNYTIQPASGNSTDPKGIVEDTINSIQKSKMEPKEGDLAFCLFDSDTDTQKQEQIDQAVSRAKQKGIEVLLSVPCFEVWFLQHFQYSTGQLTGNQAIRALKKFIPEYEKSKSVFFQLEDIAVDHAKRLEKHHNELGIRSKSLKRNPSTEAYKLVELLKKE